MLKLEEIYDSWIEEGGEVDEFLEQILEERFLKQILGDGLADDLEKLLKDIFSAERELSFYSSRDEGFESGHEAGYADGFAQGRKKGFEDGLQESDERQYEFRQEIDGNGREEGYDNEFAQGNEESFEWDRE